VADVAGIAAVPPPIDGLLETALYVEDMDRAREFYVRGLGCGILLDTPRLLALSVAARQVLLLFRRGATSEPLPTAGGTVPPHGAAGVQHVAFAIPAGSADTCAATLERLGVTIESRVSWPPGGESVYVRDPDGHSIEFVTPGLWAIYR
jgi:catechol 2,3-dioxygenase-like lactoylglutathione lyase family enzyme